MKNRFATGVIAIATSAAVFGSGIAVADIDDDFTACVAKIDQSLDRETKRALHQDCELNRDIAKAQKKEKAEAEKQAAKEAAAKERANYGSVDSDTWKSIDDQLKDADKDYDAKHPYPGWFAVLKYLEVLVSEIAKQLKPILDLGKTVQDLLPKA